MRDPTAGSHRGVVQSSIKWADSHDFSLVEDDDIHRALCFFVTNSFLEGKVSWAADCLIARFSRTGTRGIPRALRCLKGFRKAAPGKSKQSHALCTWAGVILDLCQRGLVQMSLKITVGLKVETCRQQCWESRHTTVFCWFTKNVPSARQPLASGLVVAERNRAHLGNADPATRHSPHLDFPVVPSPSRILQNNSSPRDHAGTSPDEALGSVHRQNTGPTLTGSSTAQRTVETP